MSQTTEFISVYRAAQTRRVLVGVARSERAATRLAQLHGGRPLSFQAGRADCSAVAWYELHPLEGETGPQGEAFVLTSQTRTSPASLLGIFPDQAAAMRGAAGHARTLLAFREENGVLVAARGRRRYLISPQP